MEFEPNVEKLLATSRNGRIGIRNFGSAFPNLLEQIRQDRNSPFLKAWGRSFNVDELARKKIVDPKILSTIGRIAGIDIRDGNSYHAGLTHTYGYLLSLLKTKFGFKRERWTSGIIEKGFGLAERCFAPIPKQGTLFANVSHFLTTVTFTKTIKTESVLIPDSLLTFPYNKLTGTRIIESCNFAPDQHTTKIKLITDIVDFSKPIKKCSSLLIYSTLSNGKQSLISCFPIFAQSKRELIDNAIENSTSIKTRFNLAVANFPAEGVFGTRKIVDLKLQHQEIYESKKYASRKKP